MAEGEPGYDEARAVWNADIDRRPALVAQCAGVADVALCVHTAREHDLTLAVRGGSHNVAGFGTCDGGLVCDLGALRAVRVETVRGPIKFDEYGNVIGNIAIRKVEKKDGRLVNTPVHTYKDVSQFWTYKPAEFLKHPVWSRDYPPMKA